MKKLLTSLILMLALLMPMSMVEAKSAAPSKVTVKSLKASGTTQITVKWGKAKNVTAYQISYREGSGKWKVIATVKSNKTSYTHKANFKGGKKYTYQVKGYNSKTKKYGAAKAKSITLPPIPGTVKMTSAKFSGKNVIINWKKTTNATEYRVYYKASKNAKWKKIATVKPNKTTYTYKNGKAGFYTVAAYNNKSKKQGAYNTAGLQVKKATSTKPSTPSKPTPTPTPSKPTANLITHIDFGALPERFTAAGQTYQMKTIIFPSNATNKTLSWSSSNTKVATVSQSGLITAVSDGSAIIKAKATDGSGEEVETKIEVDIAGVLPPKIYYVDNITLNKKSLTFTAKGQTETLIATVTPSIATVKTVTWKSEDTSIATVDSNGTVTAVSNGTTSVSAQSNDGSYITVRCQVTVEIPEQPKDNTETISLAGGKGNTIGPDFMEFSSVDFSKVTFEFSNGFENNFEINGYNSTEYAAGVTITALRKGSATVVAKYEGKVIKKYNVVATSDWAEYLGYVSWRKSVESQIWKSNMSVKEKLDAAQNYIKTNFTYKLGADGPVYAYNQTPKTADCTTASSFMGDFAKDLGCTVGYVNMTTDQVYNFMAEAMGAAGGHIFTVVKLNGQWVSYDAQPPHN